MDRDERIRQHEAALIRRELDQDPAKTERLLQRIDEARYLIEQRYHLQEVLQRTGVSIEHDMP